MNAIYALLDEVTRTGRLPDDDQIAAVVNRGRPGADRDNARRTIGHTARRIIAALDTGLPDQAAQLAEATAEQLAGYTRDGDTDVSPRELADAVPRTRHHADHHQPHPDAAARQALAELLGSRIRDRVTAADLDRLAVRPGATPGEVKQWRDDVFAAAREIRETYRTGQQGNARRLIGEHSDRLAGMLATPDHRDRHEDVDDPRQLADLVPRDRSR